MNHVNFCHCGNVLDVLPRLVADGIKAQCVVTSPPYWRLRDYGVDGQLGLEKTPSDYVAKMVEVFGYVYQLLNDDGVMWLNLGDSYSSYKQASNPASIGVPPRSAEGLPHKNLVGIPWRVAFALQEIGWILRSDIIWHKQTAMPESIKDRPTRCHEYIFLFTKSQCYFYNTNEAKEDVAPSTLKKKPTSFGGAKGRAYTPRESDPNYRNGAEQWGRTWSLKDCNPDGLRNMRSVWSINHQVNKSAHFAVFPKELARRCIAIGSRPGDVVCDPFMGSGTVAVVAENLGRRWVGIELNPEYIGIQDRRLAEVNPLLKAVNL